MTDVAEGAAGEVAPTVSSSRLSFWADGFATMAIREPGAFEALVKQPYTGRAIDKDLPRTYADEAMFSNMNGDAVARLRKLLCALHARQGYCQGYNYIAAHLLLEASVEGSSDEDLFWVLAAATQTCHGMWSETMPLCQLSVAKIDSQLKARHPALAAHLSRHAVQSVGEVARPWLLCLFAHPSIPQAWRTWLWDLMAASGAEFTAGEEDQARAHVALAHAQLAVVAIAIRLEARLLQITDASELQQLLGNAWSESGGDDAGVRDAVGDMVRRHAAEQLPGQTESKPPESSLRYRR